MRKFPLLLYAPYVLYVLFLFYVYAIPPARLLLMPCACFPQVQWNLLMEQQAANVWRKRAFAAMKSASDQFGKDTQSSDRLLGCLDTFRERVDHNVENTVPLGQVRKSASGYCVRWNMYCVVLTPFGTPKEFKQKNRVWSHHG